VCLSARSVCDVAMAHCCEVHMNEVIIDNCVQ
jgi:hypothetical protein